MILVSNTHSYLYSLLDPEELGVRNVCVGEVELNVTRRSVGELESVVGSGVSTGNVGRTFGPVSVSSTR